MAAIAPPVARVHVQIATSASAGHTVVLVTDPAKGDYRFVVRARDVRAIAEALRREIDASPELFPFTHTRLVNEPAARKRG